jgi:uncharacterized damage-inducible protein DinB
MPERTLTELLYGRGAHANSIACVEGLTADLASRQIAGFPHSIWQLVFHLNYWIDYDLSRIRGEHPPCPAHADESWPLSPAPADEMEWRQAAAHFAALIRDLELLANSAPEELQREVEVQPGHAQQSSSMLAVLWQTVVHNSYHLGQIALLRRTLAVWPPPAGGDTW